MPRTHLRRHAFLTSNVFNRASAFTSILIVDLLLDARRAVMTYSDYSEDCAVGEAVEMNSKYQSSVNECAVVHGFGWKVVSAANGMRKALHTQAACPCCMVG